MSKLNFKCVRCGAPVATKGGRCKICLAKLRANKKNPNRHEHYDKLVSDAKRRQRGGKGSTAYAKSSGTGSTQEIKKKIKEGYKKYGKGVILSPDRKDNKKGYSASNVRMVPKELNRGRHVVDKKKLKEWKDKVKKNSINPSDLQKAVVSNAYRKGFFNEAIALDSTNFIEKLFKIN
jgi:hypothetical protein